jgi:hypothetical protein
MRMKDKLTGTLEELVTDEELRIAYANANFGPMSPREVIKQGLLKCAGCWHQGHTSQQILIELGLISKNYKLTKKGGRYLYRAFPEGANF